MFLFRFVGEESFFQEIFDQFILDQKDRAKEREHKRRDDKVFGFVSAYVIFYEFYILP